MPVVPTYDNLRTSVAPMPGPQVGPMDGPARQSAQFGEAVGRAGGALQSIMLDEQQRADQTRIADAMNQAVAARLRLTHDQNDGYTRLVGRSALERPDGKGLDEEYAGRLKGDIDAIDAGLGNDQQRRVFRQQAGQMLVQFGADVAQYRNRQHTAYQISTAEGTIATARDMASLESGNPEAVAQAQGAIKAAVYELGRLHGWSAQETLAKTVEQLSPMHASVVASSVDGGRLDYARQYMDQVKAELTPQARMQLGAALKIGDTNARAQAFGDEVIGKGLTLSDALGEARKRFEGGAEVAAVREVKDRFAEQEIARARDVKAVGSAAWSAVMATGRIPPTMLADLRAKAPEEERQIRDWLEAKQRRAKADAEGKQQTDMDVYYGLRRMAMDDPAAFSALDLRRSQPYLKDGDLKHLIEIQGSISKGDAKAMESQRVVKQTLGAIRAEVTAIGIDLSPKEGSPQANETARFLGALTQALDDATRGKGAPLTPDEAKRIGMGMVREGVEQGSGVFGTFQTKKRGYQIATDPDIAPGASFVNARFSDIPAAARNGLAAELRQKRGIGTRALTSSEEAEIERAYTRGIQTGRFK
jgi:hypothetical protein